MMQPIPPLPPAFIARMRTLLGQEADAYFAALAQPYVRGLRWNSLKPCPRHLVEGLLSPIPWQPDACYLALDSAAGSHPLHDAGAYYLQEPSAMIPAQVLAPKPGERILDLCAAPGGKSTQLSQMLDGEGLLAANEPVLSRARTLSGNLERMGAVNALVVSADPSQLAAKWPCAFDAVLADAPCSGEGMFRRHPETRLQWDENAPMRCAARQRLILESALAMLRPGGRLVYSTCTLNREENEETIAALLSEHRDLLPVDFSVPLGGEKSLRSTGGMLRVTPLQLAGEGHFIALLRKEEGALAQKKTTAFSPPQHALRPPAKAAAKAYADFADTRAFPLPNAMLGETLLHAPDLPPLDGIKVLRAGLHLGLLKGKVFAPDHGLAMAPRACSMEAIPLTLEEARAYQRGECLTKAGAPKGYALAVYEGLALGFVKGSEGQLKNHYPKGLRRPC